MSSVSERSRGESYDRPTDPLRGRKEGKGVKGTLFPSELMGTFAFSEKCCPRLHFLQEIQALPRL